ncbi:uncharacterized protein LOC34623727 [Cyclospora cayetanensis]|uniref:Uncharacterized protein LOC34623727 n=1 Tax=Cyclospora cayetanensis TaxID=88456 RepID=A0A6P6RRI2_9EIME|nr:uncharacterized protein LOC34623727 [Cyclospora cayetanensis]
MEVEEVLLHDGVASLLQQHAQEFAAAEISNSSSSNSGGEACGCTHCRTSAESTAKVRASLGRCCVAVLAGVIEEGAAAATKQPQKAQQKLQPAKRATIVSCFKLREFSAAVEAEVKQEHQHREKEFPSLLLQRLAAAAAAHHSLLVKDIRSVRAALPLGVDILGVWTPVPLQQQKQEEQQQKQKQEEQQQKQKQEEQQQKQKQEEQQEDRLRPLYQLASALNTAIENTLKAVDEDEGIPDFCNTASGSSCLGRHDKVCFVAVAADAPKEPLQHTQEDVLASQFAAFDLSRAGSSAAAAGGAAEEGALEAQRIRVQVGDVLVKWQSTRGWYLLHSRLPLQLMLSAEAAAGCLQQQQIAACCCSKGLLLPSLAPAAAEELLQQLQMQTQQLLQEDALFFRLPNGEWLAPVAASRGSNSGGTAAAAATATLGAAFSAAKKAARQKQCEGSSANSRSHRGTVASECSEFAVQQQHFQHAFCQQDDSQEEELPLPLKELTMHIPAARRLSSCTAAAVGASLICAAAAAPAAGGDSEQALMPGSAVVYPEASLRGIEEAEKQQRDVSVSQHARVAEQRAAVTACGSESTCLIACDVCLLLRRDTQQQAAADSLLHALLLQLRFLGGALSQMAAAAAATANADASDGGGTLKKGAYATQPFLVHSLLLADCMAPHFSVSFCSFLPCHYALPLTACSTELPSTRSQQQLRRQKRCVSRRTAHLLERAQQRGGVLHARSGMAVSVVFLCGEGVEGEGPCVPHLALSAGPKVFRRARVSLVRGLCDYYHYMQPVPTHWDIQKLLKDNDDAFSDLQVGSPRWIGTIEAQYVLNWYLEFGCRVIYLQHMEEIEAYMGLLLAHFARQQTPVIMGVGQFAYLLLGVAQDLDTQLTALPCPPRCLSAICLSGKLLCAVMLVHFAAAGRCSGSAPSVELAALRYSEHSMHASRASTWPHCIACADIDFLERAAAGSFVNLLLPHTSTEDGRLVF